jgi:hypothetical protein
MIDNILKRLPFSVFGFEKGNSALQQEREICSSLVGKDRPARLQTQ